MNRTPKTNSVFIRKHYKTSTIGRLGEFFGYDSIKKMNSCPIISEWLDLCYNSKLAHGYSQDDFFSWIYAHQKIESVRNFMLSNDTSINLKEFRDKMNF